MMSNVSSSFTSLWLGACYCNQKYNQKFSQNGKIPHFSYFRGQAKMTLVHTFLDGYEDMPGCFFLNLMTYLSA